MADDTDLDIFFDLPGGDDFDDVTDLFADAAGDMSPEDILLTDGFTLLDAMSAFEIGEPRMDSGMLPEQPHSASFDPLSPMLPQEICWIMDRSFACEMEWHAGNSLSQTVYTLLYVHCLTDMNPDFIPRVPRTPADPLRPQELVTVVLRAAVFGLLKCCDLSWREMSKGRLFDNEDWQGEKCDISLLKNINAEQIIERLQAAGHWLRRSTLPDSDIEALCDRIELRMYILQLLKLDYTFNQTARRSLISASRERLQRISARDLEPPCPGSPAFSTFDPHITRRIPNFMPVRVIELMTMHETWAAIHALFAGWEQLCDLLDSPSISSWEAVGTVGVWSQTRQLHKPVIRSSIQSAIFDTSTVFGRHPTAWLIDRFFVETLGITYATVIRAVERSAEGTALPSMKDIERRLTKLTIYHAKSYWANPSRRRRYLMHSILEWQQAYDTLYKIALRVAPPDQECSDIVVSIPKAALFWRLVATREVILSGFHQDLYAPDERSIAYWHLAQVLEEHLKCIDELSVVIPKDSQTYEEFKFQFQFLTALQIMSTAMCALTSKQVTAPFRRTSLNFSRRYKWAFRSEFDDLAPIEPALNLISFRAHVTQMLQDEDYSPSASFMLAGDILQRLSESNIRGYSEKWAGERFEFVRSLADVCRGLSEATPTNQRTLNDFEPSKAFKWDPQVHPWFPVPHTI
ncbi:Mak10-domain-containing protein [Amylocystis lapponica]|nr:Mak10-domain-containing protein [Amylocystis lapponica]